MAVWSTEETDPKPKDISPYDKFGPYTGTPGPNGTISYQKKLQLPQSRWETFQRIRQNRQQRLQAFMRITKRKYDSFAYESMAAAAGLTSPLGPSAPGAPQPPQPHHLAPPTGPQTMGPGFHPHHPHHHHSPSSSSTSSSSASATHRSPSSVAIAGASAHAPGSNLIPHANASHPIGVGLGPYGEHHPFGGSKVSPTGATEAGGHPDGAGAGLPPRGSPGSTLVNSAATYPTMFAQNPAAAFLHPGLPFYPSAYHAAAAAAAAAQLQSSPTAATGPWSMAGAGYPCFGPNPAEHHFAAFGATVPISTASGTGIPKIWRSVDPDALEAGLSDDGIECSSKKSLSESISHIAKKLKKDEETLEGSIDVGGGPEKTSRCNSGASSHGDAQGEDGAQEDSNDGQQLQQRSGAIAALSDDSNHSSKVGAKEEADSGHAECRGHSDQDGSGSVHSSTRHASDGEEREDRQSEPEEEEDDVDVVSSDSEANHPVRGHQRSGKRSASPFEVTPNSTFGAKHRAFTHAQLYGASGQNHGGHHRHPTGDSFTHAHHHFAHSHVTRSDSVGSATETTAS